MEDVVSYRGKRSRREEPITMTIADGSGVIVLHLAPILKTGKFPVELKSKCCSISVLEPILTPILCRTTRESERYQARIRRHSCVLVVKLRNRN